jgi:hypothetical protein
MSSEKQAWRRWDIEGAITRVIRAVANRASTFPSDEALCLALLLGIDARSIIAAKNKLKAREQLEKAHLEKLNFPESQKERLKLEKEPMLILLRLLDGSIPPGDILLPGPWQDDFGFQWAPKSFLNGPQNSGTLNVYLISIPRSILVRARWTGFQVSSVGGWRIESHVPRTSTWRSEGKLLPREKIGH